MPNTKNPQHRYRAEPATLGWVDWWNHHRLHGACDDTPAAEFESRYYAEQPAVPVA